MKIIILPGWQHNKEIWSQSADQLSHIIPTKAIDLPGFGEEPLVNEKWGIPQYAEWVQNYIEKNQLTEVILLGHSFGGRITSYLASQNPKWLKAIILVASPSIRRPTQSIIWKIKFYKAIKTFLPSSLRKIFYPKELQTAHQSNMGHIFRNAVNFDQTTELKKIIIPTLIIWGDQDRESSLALAQEMHQLIKNSKLEIIKKAGHMPSYDNPHLFYGIIKNFIKTL